MINEVCRIFHAVINKNYFSLLPRCLSKIKILLIIILCFFYIFGFAKSFNESNGTSNIHPSTKKNFQSMNFSNNNLKRNKPKSPKQNNIFSLLSNFFTEKKNNPEKKDNYKCLILPEEKLLNDKDFNIEKLSNKEKVNYFKHGMCHPIILIPGIFGTKLEFKLNDCKTFKTFHRNIMESCGWKDCDSDDFPQTFKIWFEIGADQALHKFMKQLNLGFLSFLNTKGQEQEISSNKKFYTPFLIKYFDHNGNKIYFNKSDTEKCFGNLFRIYYSKSESIDTNCKEDNTQQCDKINIEGLKGAEIKILSENLQDCGSEATSDFSKPFTDYLGKGLLGYKTLNEHLTKLGYVQGLSLFNIPYDFRYQINQIMPKIIETLKLAYKINKKKAIVIGHSYGGLLSYKLSTFKEKELIEHAILIGAPLLGSFASIKNTFGIPENFSHNEQIEILGSNIGNIQTELPIESMDITTSSFNLLQFFPKAIKKDETYPIIKKIDEIEKFYKLNKNQNNNIESDYLRLFDLKGQDKEILKKFYQIFPKANKKCEGISSVNKGVSKENNLCKINLFDIKDKVLLETVNKISSPKINKLNRNTTEKIILEKATGKDNRTDSVIKRNFVTEILLKSEKLRDKFNLMNEDIHKLFKLDYSDYIEYLVSSYEMDLFENFVYPDLEVTFIYSNAFKTSAVTRADFNSKKEKVLESIPGDKSIHAISAIYPGINWFLKSLINPEKYNYNKGIHFVEYCAQFKKQSKNDKNDSNKIFKKNKNQYIPLKCECMDNLLNKSKKKIDIDSCNHAAMINDKYVIDLIKNIILNGKQGQMYESKDEEFKNLYQAKFDENFFCENFKYLYHGKKNKENNKNPPEPKNNFSINNISNILKMFNL